MNSGSKLIQVTANPIMRESSTTPQKNGNQHREDARRRTSSLTKTDTTPPHPEPTHTSRMKDGPPGPLNQHWTDTSVRHQTEHNRHRDPATGLHRKRAESSHYHQQADNHPNHVTMPEHDDNNPQRPLTIRQQNTNKSLLSQLDLLESLKRDDYDICAIQEPYIDFNGKSRANRQWTTIYPTTHSGHPDSTRSLLLINTDILSDSWKQLNIQHPDITAIELKGPFGTIRIINIYNDCNNNNALAQVSIFMRDRVQHVGRPAPIHTIWLGDFNRHHPLWDEERNAHLFTRRNMDLTQPLLEMIGQHNMKMALPPATPTLQGTEHR
jgi:hypothetical protein